MCIHSYKEILHKGKKCSVISVYMQVVISEKSLMIINKALLRKVFIKVLQTMYPAQISQCHRCLKVNRIPNFCSRDYFYFSKKALTNLLHIPSY